MKLGMSALAGATVVLLLGCAGATRRTTIALEDRIAPIEWVELPVGGVYATPVLSRNREGNLVLYLTARSVGFSRHHLRVYNERSQEIAIVSEQIDEHRQIRRSDGAPREMLVSTWSAVLSANPSARKITVLLTRLRPNHYEMKWENLDIPLESVFIH